MEDVWRRDGGPRVWLLSASKGPERLTAATASFTTRAQTSLSLAPGRQIYWPKENKATGFLATTLYVAIFPYCTAAKKRVGTAKKTATVFWNILARPGTFFIASPGAQVKVRRGPLGSKVHQLDFMTGARTQTKKVKCYLTRPLILHRLAVVGHFYFGADFAKNTGRRTCRTF
jgi:hypothetical protein